MDDDKETGLDDRVELIVRRVIAQELTEHRNYIGQLSKFTAIAAFAVLAILATALTFWFGNRLDDLQETMLPDAIKQMEESIANTNSNLVSTANRLVAEAIAQLNIETMLEREFDSQARTQIVQTLIKDEQLLEGFGSDTIKRIEGLEVGVAISNFILLADRYSMARCLENPFTEYCERVRPPIAVAYGAAASVIISADRENQKRNDWCTVMSDYTNGLNAQGVVWPHVVLDFQNLDHLAYELGAYCDEVNYPVLRSGE